MSVILGLACRLGQRKFGVEMGPEVLASYIPYIKENMHTIIFDSKPNDNRRKRNLVSNGYAETYRLNKSAGDKRVLNIGGDHSVGHSTVAGSVDRYGKKLKVLWVDAHTDINTFKSSETKNTHGMPLSSFFGLMKPWINTKARLDPSQLVYVGVRSIDEAEQQFIKALNIKAYSADDVKYEGINNVMNDIMKPNEIYHISFDIDSLDPQYAPSTGTPVENGLSYNDAMYLIDRIKKTNNLKCFDLVEFNPRIGSRSDIYKTTMTCLDIIEKVLI